MLYETISGHKPQIHSPDSDAPTGVDPVDVWRDRAAEIIDIGRDMVPPRTQEATQIVGRLCGVLGDLMAIEALRQHSAEIDPDDLELLGASFQQQLLVIWRDAAGLSCGEIRRHINEQCRTAA